MISITAFGRVPPQKMVRRFGAKPGDRVVVTGTIGDAMLGLRILQGGIKVERLGDETRNYLIQRYRVPQPRNTLAEAIRNYASAALDISDGLAGDLAKLCAVSEVSATVNLSSIPLSDAAKTMLSQGQVDLQAIVSGGDDYEVLCTIPENRWESFAAVASRAGIAATSIGAITVPAGLPRFVDVAGIEVVLKRLSYSHF
jgi:thiamine-monophosphate kinase